MSTYFQKEIGAPSPIIITLSSKNTLRKSCLLSGETMRRWRGLAVGCSWSGQLVNLLLTGVKFSVSFRWGTGLRNKTLNRRSILYYTPLCYSSKLLNSFEKKIIKSVDISASLFPRSKADMFARRHLTSHTTYTHTGSPLPKLMLFNLQLRAADAKTKIITHRLGIDPVLVVVRSLEIREVC